MAFIKDNPAPATVVLISGDRDFAYLLSTIRWRQYSVVLVSNTFMTHDSLSNQANVTFDWQADVLKTRNEVDGLRSSTNRGRRDTTTSVPSTHVALESVETHRPALNNKINSLSESRPLSSGPGVARTSSQHSHAKSTESGTLAIPYRKFSLLKIH
jgi:NYN domain